MIICHRRSETPPVPEKVHFCVSLPSSFMSSLRLTEANDDVVEQACTLASRTECRTARCMLSPIAYTLCTTPSCGTNSWMRAGQGSSAERVSAASGNAEMVASASTASTMLIVCDSRAPAARSGLMNMGRCDASPASSAAASAHSPKASTRTLVAPRIHAEPDVKRGMSRSIVVMRSRSRSCHMRCG